MSTATAPHILVPTDFGPAADAALEQAIALASALQAELTILHVCETPQWDHPEHEQAPNLARAEASARSALDALITKRVSGRVSRVTGLVQHGSAWKTVNDVARSIGAGLIVMGTHGARGWLSRELIGGVAEKVVRTASVPVLTVHAPKEAQVAGLSAGA